MKKTLVFHTDIGCDEKTRKYVKEKYKDEDVEYYSDFSFSLSSLIFALKKIKQSNREVIFSIVPPFNYIKQFLLALVLLLSLAKENLVGIWGGEGVRINFLFYIKLILKLPLFIIYNFIALIYSVFYFIIFYFILKKPAPLHTSYETEENKTTTHIPQRIMCIYPNFSFSYVPNAPVAHARGVVEAFQSLGYKPVLSAPNKILGLEGDYKIIKEIGTDYIITPYLRDIFYGFYSGFKMVSEIKKERGKQGYGYSFIYQRHCAYNISGAMVSFFTGIPLILEANAVLSNERKRFGRKKFMLEPFEKMSFNCSHKILAVASDMTEELESLGIPAHRIFVAPNGVDPRVFHPDCGGENIRKELKIQDKTVIGFCGSFKLWHGVDTLSFLIPRILAERENTVFLLIGDGNKRKELEDSIPGDMKERVIFTGTLPHRQVPPYLDACDILLSMVGKDRANTSPVKLFEYMAMQKATVCYNVGQMPEIIENRQEGLLVEDENKEEFLSAVIELTDNPSLRQSMGKKALEKVLKQYTWTSTVNKILENYRDLYR